MDTLSLVIASSLIILPIVISYREKLGLEKDIIISMARAVIQLIIVGYVLDLVFGMENPIFTVALLILILVNAARNTIRRGGKIKNVFWISMIAMFIGTSITIIVLVLSGAISFTANKVIPVAGMIVSNSMIAIGLSYRNLNSMFETKRNEVEVKLSLGADIKESSIDILRDSIKLAIQPGVDSAQTLGIVALPGMMTGQILAGTSPLVAIKFQIMVTFMILASSSMATLIATFLCYKSFFNSRKQLVQ